MSSDMYAKIALAWALAACAAAPSHRPGANLPTASTGANMEPLFEVRNVSVSIQRKPEDVYAFVSNGENVPRWAAGLGKSIERVGRDWVADGPLGKVKLRFAEANSFGVADHDVELETGIVVHNPMRVVPNRAGSTVIFTLLRRTGVSEGQFAADMKAVERDLETLKQLLEG
jgi:hypothetical protein